MRHRYEKLLLSYPTSLLYIVNALNTVKLLSVLLA